MRILVVGGGGREHALAWKLAQSPRAERVYVAPGNAGTAAEPGCENVAIAAEDIDALLAFAQGNGIDLTVVGPEAPLVAGIVDAFEAAGLKCFGPHKAAAQLEGSKSFSKAFLARHGIPTAAYGSFTEVDAALAFLARQSLPIVVKADGLAAGKGVVIAGSREQAEQAVRDMLEGNRFGSAGAAVVIEEFLLGEEASFIVMCDGDQVLPLASSQDHKARDDGDRGPNTGGMGAYSPAPVVTPAMHETIMRTVIRPTMAGLAAEGIRYRGFLYAGVMIGADGIPKVLEFNCRFGDPETQPVLMRLQADFAELCERGVDGRLADAECGWDARAALAVVMAAGGYPEAYEKGKPITGLAEADAIAGVKVFHAGTRMAGDAVLSNGGRVLAVCALGETVAAAQALAYQGVRAIHWERGFCRGDIGYRAVAREQAVSTV